MKEFLPNLNILYTVYLMDLTKQKSYCFLLLAAKLIFMAIEISATIFT